MKQAEKRPASALTDAEVTLTICRLDVPEVALALLTASQKREREGLKLMPGVRRDNLLARALRLKRTAEELGANHGQ